MLKSFLLGFYKFIITLSSCTSELDINSDPNAPTAVPNSTLLTSLKVRFDT
jgi:hypothetical protein